MESLREEIARMRKSLVDAGTLDGAFEEVESSNKKNYPMSVFIQQAMTAYYDESAKLLSSIDDLMVYKAKEIAEIDKAVKELRTKSSNVGAKKVKIAVNATRDLLRQEDLKGAKKSLAKVAFQLTDLMNNLQPYLSLLKLAEAIEKSEKDEGSSSK
ncbi:hypothetical protein ACFE04_011668 [Oxalis oulophora]